jgi:hypothetical protein
MNWITELHQRNNALAWYSWVTLLGGIICLVLSKTTAIQINNINAFVKPTKFFFSVCIFCLTMGWIGYELHQPNVMNLYNIVLIVVMSFELFVITWQAANGRLSHFNISKPLYSTLFSLMGVAISILTLHTAYLGYLFFKIDNLNIPMGYLWGIRLGIILFVIFAFEGGIMGAKLQHTVGAADGSNGIAFLNWSKHYGDLRIAHFLGMHSLQLLPLLGFYVFKNPAGIIAFAIVYFGFVVYNLVIALRGLALFK